MEVKITGLTELTQKLDSLLDINDGMKKCCALVERSAKEKVPVQTGELRRSITSKVENNGLEVTGTIYTPLEYAPYIEYGTGLFAEKGGRPTPWCYQDDKGEWHTTSARAGASAAGPACP